MDTDINKHKKIIVFPHASDEQIQKLAEQLARMEPGDDLLMTELPTLIDLEDVKTLSKEHVEQWCRMHKMILKQKT